MELNKVKTRVLVKGKPVTEYAHNGSIFIEGREGSNFEIEVENTNDFRVEAIVTLDGLSVLDGKEGGPNSPGFLLEPRQRLVIPGWKVNQDTAAKFFFSGKGESYSTVMTGSARNNGVIGIMAYAERNRRPVTKTTQVHQPAWGVPHGGWVGSFPNGGLVGATMPVTLNNTRPFNAADTVGQGALATTSFAATSFEDTTTVSVGYAGPERRTKSATRARFASPSVDVAIKDESFSVNNLGAGFGSATVFETETASFDRGDLLGVLVLYYDNARGLKQRGIQVGRPSRVKHTAQTPQAFPAMNCTPPAGWRG